MIKEQTIIKKDSPENWNKAKNFVPKEGEIIVYLGMGMKLGNGETKVNDLPFVSQTSYAVEDNILVIEDNAYRRIE